MNEPDRIVVGRDSQLGALDEALAGLERERHPRAVALAGEPGIGKTRMLAEVGDRAGRRGLLVLSGAASELEVGGCAPTSAARMRSPRAAPRPRRARTTSSTRRATATPPPSRS
jgi:hypothetical protein